MSSSTATAALQADLDRLSSTHLATLRCADAHQTFCLLCAAETKFNAMMLMDVSGAEVGVAALTVAAHRRCLLRSLSVEQQDTLMSVLYAYMAPCATAMDDENRGASLRRAYDWHAVLHEVAGDGAVMRALMRR